MKSNGISSKLLGVLVVLLCFVSSNAVQSDIDCLRSIKSTLQDPENLLASWDFSNMTEGYICRFTGVECWHPDESKVMNIDLSDMGLRGPFPVGLKNCTSLTGLDLSSNHFTGPLPSNFSDVLPFIASLDLSSNDFLGSIPPSIGNISNINVLRLNNNRLTGKIPPELGNLYRLKEFSVANNRLRGQVPYFRNFTASTSSYANNRGLCGVPLRTCKKEGHEDLFFLGFEVGFPASTVLTMLLMIYCLPTLSVRNMTLYRLVEKIKGRRNNLIPGTPLILIAENCSSEASKISTLEEFICRMSLEELNLATNSFDNKKVIGHGNMGVMYKAMFPSGLQLAVKRLHKFESFEKEFLLEIEILGRLRHINLVPLLGFCYEREKKMGWPLRFKIAIGIARGLTWHHNNVLRVAHLNISSRCILLDDKFEPKISNFGNSNILMNTSGIPSSGCTFVVPDASPSPYKEDVYKFGILLHELVTGRESSTWINSSTDHVGSRELTVIDESLMGQGFNEEIRETLKVAEKCIRAQTNGEIYMLQVYQELHAIRISSNVISDDLCMDIEEN